VLIIGALVNYIVTQLVQKTGLSITDRFFGAIFGGVRGILIVLLIVFIVSATNFQSAEWYQKSQLTYRLQGVSNWIQDSAIKVTDIVTKEK
jgi:membrane protein required for colicin V production